MTSFNNCSDIIDSRDIIERIEELESIIEDAEEILDKDMQEEKEELEILIDLQNETESYAPDWNHGTALINEDYFTEYAEHLCKDIGVMPNDIPPYIENNINWEGVADDIKMDYSAVEFDGQTFYIS